jgi:hypothetical protein
LDERGADLWREWLLHNGEFETSGCECLRFASCVTEDMSRHAFESLDATTGGKPWQANLRQLLALAAGNHQHISSVTIGNDPNSWQHSSTGRKQI